MDIAGAQQKLVKIEGAVRELASEDKRIVDLVVWLFEVISERAPEVRHALLDALTDRISEEFKDNMDRARDRTTYYGLEKLEVRLLKQG